MKYVKKGFTVAELLIVCAIVGILVAISLPILNVQLEKSREAHDIALMRTAAAAAMEYYYIGDYVKYSADLDNETDPEKKNIGLSVDRMSTGPESWNAYGAYDPRTGKIYRTRDLLPPDKNGKRYVYGKGTKVDGGTRVPSGSETGEAYQSTEDYRNAVVMVSIYAKAATPHIDVYWKDNTKSTNSNYIGGKASNINGPKRCLRLYPN
ncbi:type IV pilin protein [Oribacterium sp. FC2011]|uniref:type IV pilin protein n=1 Tax=Oribacterium sp. FC2011 TaxID=1408311 RepID=UPI0005D258B4|nr:prepilin-type N-terminal cleavage/methylation domain-containing protein [Oribacterium sp. FC2011]